MVVSLNSRLESNKEEERVPVAGSPPHSADLAREARQLSSEEQPLHINVQWFQGGLVFEAHRLLYHSA